MSELIYRIVPFNDHSLLIIAILILVINVCGEGGSVAVHVGGRNQITFLLINPSDAEAFLSEAQKCKDLWKTSKPCHIGIHWIALAENS